MEQEGGGKRAERSSPSNTSSQGDMADTEMEAGPSKPSETTINEPPPPKKKRTRTLTTPHQSAVLHALLAQSRFPTTAMREEVGRSIGLSARKVQIWFQNQRQKARRPRGQSTTTVPRPPQYGPFPNALVPTRNDSSTEAGPSAQRISTFLQDSSMSAIHAESYGGTETSALSPVEGTSRREAHASEGYATSVTSSHLAGPGIPGSSGHRTTSLRAEESQMLTSMTMESRMTARFSPVRPYTSALFSARGSMEPYSSSSRAIRGTQSGVTRPSHSPLPYTLPPIQPESQTDRASAPAASSSTGHTLAPGVSGGPSQSSHAPEPFTHRNPNIPPPFTLEPRPQWDESAFSPFSRRPVAAPPYPRSSFDIPHSSISPPLISIEGRGRDASPILLLRNPALIQSVGPSSQPGNSLPSPQTLLGSLWTSRGSVPLPTEPRESRRTSAHSDDPENDPNVNRSR